MLLHALGEAPMQLFRGMAAFGTRLGLADKLLNMLEAGAGPLPGARLDSFRPTPC